MGYYVEIIRKDGSSERFPITGGQVTLGRSGQAGISLPTMMDLEMEHLLLAPRADGCWVSVAQTARTPAKLKGKSFQNGTVKWGAELRIGESRFKIAEDKKKSASGGSGSKPSPVLLLALLVAGAYLAYTFLQPEAGALPSSEGIVPPELFDEPQTCPASESALELTEKAHAFGDRYVYELDDGVQAVFFYEQAIECWKKQGDPTKVNTLTVHRDNLRARINADYASRRLRLTRANAENDWEGVVQQVTALMQLASHKADSPYMAWLSQTKRIAIARLAQAPKEKEE